MLRDVAEALLVALSVEKSRRSVGPTQLVKRMRGRGRRRRARDLAERLKLRRAIEIVDRRFPSGPNCYRRVLIEIAMDAGAAAEPLHMGLKAHGEPGSGHAWLASMPRDERSYDAEFVV
jgi:hypothetical protein